MNTTAKSMTAAQITHFTGKRVDAVKWIIPDGYERCAMTGKMLPESELEVSFNHHAFSIEARRAAGIASIEDASWLSEEGFYQILDALGVSEGEYSEIVYNFTNPAAPVVDPAPVQTDDIVTRLEGYSTTSGIKNRLMHEAADEIHKLRADLAQARAEVEALRDVVTPCVDVTPMYDIWGCKGKVYLGSVKVFETDWYDNKDRAREVAQAFADTLTAELTQR